MTEYPDYWICQRCSRPFSLHVALGTPYENERGTLPASKNWCYTWKELEEETKKINEGKLIKNKKYYRDFQPVDNLTLIENLAKEKGITTGKPNPKNG